MEFFELLNNILGGWPIIILLVGTGLFLTIFLRLIQVRGFLDSLRVTSGKYSDKKDPGEISSFQALMAELSATVGTGNIVGVAAAITIGGPGAVFWMWVTAMVGMATKFTSCTLAVHYRRIDEKGEAHGGPMYYIEYGLGKNWKWLAMAFAFFAFIASFGGGNMFQINAVTENLSVLLNGAESDPSTGFRWTVGIIFAILTGLVIIGGIKSIGRVASFLVPFMCLMYMAGGLVILAMNLPAIPGAFAKIVYYAFNVPGALEGGLLGTVIRVGVARGLFSNEAGLGSSPIAHGAAKTDEPVREGLVAMLGPFIDTIIVCSVTALVIVASGADEMGAEIGASGLTSYAYGLGLGTEWGTRVVALAVVFFAFSTMLTWSYYGNRAIEYLLGSWAVRPYQFVFCAFIVLGAVRTLEEILVVADVMNALMAFPNLVALILLSPIVAKLAADYFKRMREEEATGAA